MSISQLIQQLTGARSVSKMESIQSLWSGYGEIARYRLDHASLDTVIVKHVTLPNDQASANHPRGWNTSRSHHRKVRSYQVESHWYSEYSARCNENCKVPVCYGEQAESRQYVMVMEDLDASGYAIRKTTVRTSEIQPCLKWLATFHAAFLVDTEIQSINTNGLWDVGCYWHLDTRPDELEALQDQRLKSAATKIDNLLSDCQFQTLVHGDAKLANFCFSSNSDEVAAVDFQYVGGGCGMKDLAYFIGSCLAEDDCEKYAEQLLDDYFNYLDAAINAKALNIEFNKVEAAWRPLFPVAWADFHRFLKGWSPDHWKINSYSERITKQVLEKIEQDQL